MITNIQMKLHSLIQEGSYGIANNSDQVLCTECRQCLISLQVAVSAAALRCAFIYLRKMLNVCLINIQITSNLCELVC